MFSFSKKTEGKLNLILDIKSSVVRATLVLLKTGELPYVMWTNNIEIPYKSGSDSGYMLTETIKAIKKVAGDAHLYTHNANLQNKSPKNISVIHMVLSSPWIISQARTIDQKFNNDTKISASHVHEIIQTERAKLMKNDVSLTGIEEKIFDVKLNGYSIPKWQGNIAKTLSISFAISLASKKITQAFIDACKEAGLHGARIDFHSSLLLQHIGLCRVLSLQDPYVLVHVHGELTDIVCASGQSCVLFGSYPVGIRTITRNLMNNLNVSESTADSTLTLYENKQIDKLHGASDITSIDTAASSWIQGCSNILSLVPGEHQPLRAIISSRFHEAFFDDIFSKINPNIKAESLPTDKILSLVNFEPLIIEKLRLNVFYIVALQTLETL